MSQSQQAKISSAQSKEAILKFYLKRLKDDIRSILDNYVEIIRLAKVEDASQILRLTQAEQDQYEMQVRASNIVSLFIVNLTCIAFSTKFKKFK